MCSPHFNVYFQTMEIGLVVRVGPCQAQRWLSPYLSPAQTKRVQNHLIR